jgi:hypothetical protein
MTRRVVWVVTAVSFIVLWWDASVGTAFWVSQLSGML